MLRARDTGAAYPATGLAGQLRVVARLLKGGGGTRVYYTSQPQNAYDTHAVQLPTQAQLLGDFSRDVCAFLDELAAAKQADRVGLLAFSEFGRRPAENGSLGTDHGTAGPMFLACGLEDILWPSCGHVDSVVKRLDAAHSRYRPTVFKAAGAGHIVGSLLPEVPETISEGSGAAGDHYGLGGTPTADEAGKAAGWALLLKWLSALPAKP